MSKMYEYVIHAVYEDGCEVSLLVQWPNKQMDGLAQAVSSHMVTGDVIRIGGTIINPIGLRFVTVHTRAEYEALVEKPDEVQP